MRPTAEIRWFHEGDVPRRVDAWFHGLDGRVVEESARTDLYLRPTDDALNVKVREGSLEVKRRDAEGNTVSVDGVGVAGCLERWRKWSLGCDAPPEAGAYWVDVEKARRKHVYRIAPEGAVSPHDGPSLPPTGCDLELARVSVGRSIWWSVCLEAYGDSTRLEQVLLRAAEHVFTEGAAPRLDAAWSRGYPAWLRSLPA